MENNNVPASTDTSQEPTDTTLPEIDMPLSDAQSQQMPSGHLSYVGDSGMRAMVGNLGAWATQTSLATDVVQSEIWATKPFDPAEAEQIQQDHKANNDYWRERAGNISASSVWSKSLVNGPLSLVGGVADMGTSPQNWLVGAMTGGIGELEEGAGWLEKTLHRAARGAVVTGIGTALTAPVVNSSTEWSGQHIGLKDTAKNILYGAGGEVAIGGLGDAWKSPVMQKVRANFKRTKGADPVETSEEARGPSATLDPSAADKAFSHQSLMENEMPPAKAQMASHVAGIAKDLTDQATENLTDQEFADPAAKEEAVQDAITSNVNKMAHYGTVQESIIDTAETYPNQDLGTDTKGLSQGELHAAKQRLERAKNLAPDLAEKIKPIEDEIKKNTYGFGASSIPARYYNSIDNYHLDYDDESANRQKYLRSFSSDFEREQLDKHLEKSPAWELKDKARTADFLEDRRSFNSPITDSANEMYQQYRTLKDTITKSDGDKISNGSGLIPSHLFHDPDAIDALLKDPSPRFIPDDELGEIRDAKQRRMSARTLRKFEQDLPANRLKEYKDFRTSFFQKVPKSLLRSYRDNINKVDDYATQVNENMGQVEHPLFNHINEIEELAAAHSTLETTRQNLASVNSMLSSGTSNVNPFTEAENYFSSRGNDDNSLYPPSHTPPTDVEYSQTAPFSEPVYEDDVRKNIDEMQDDDSSKDEHVLRGTSEEMADETPEEAQGPQEESEGYSAKIKEKFGSFTAMTHSIINCILGGN